MHRKRESSRSASECAANENSTSKCTSNEACGFTNETSEVWLDHLDQLSSIPHRGFHSAFEEADVDGMLGMKPWKTIYDGISHGTTRTFTLLLVFGGMQMTAVDESETSALAMDSELCFRSNLRVFDVFRASPAPQTRSKALHHALQGPSQPSSGNSPHRVLVVSRNGTWWRRWLNEQVMPALSSQLPEAVFSVLCCAENPPSPSLPLPPSPPLLRNR